MVRRRSPAVGARATAHRRRRARGLSARSGRGVRARVGHVAVGSEPIHRDRHAGRARRPRAPRAGREARACAGHRSPRRRVPTRGALRRREDRDEREDPRAPPSRRADATPSPEPVHGPIIAAGGAWGDRELRVFAGTPATGGQVPRAGTHVRHPGIVGEDGCRSRVADDVGPQSSCPAPSQEWTTATTTQPHADPGEPS